MKIYSIIENQPRVLISHFDNKLTHIKIYMEQITEQDYNDLLELHKNEEYIWKNVYMQNVYSNNIITFGELDLNSDEVKTFIKENNDLLVNANGFWRYSSFNYEEGTIHTDDRYGEEKTLGYDSTNALENLKYKHCKINKSKYVIIYKEIYKKYAGKLKKVS